jgi:hypothetical protein
VLRVFVVSEDRRKSGDVVKALENVECLGKHRRNPKTIMQR